MLQTLITWAALGLIAVGFGGGGFVLIRQATTAARRRARLAGEAGEGVAALGTGLPGAADIARGVRRLGDRMAITDPSKLSALRLRLMQAGYFNREAAAMYLGARAAALIAAIVATVLVLPFALSGAGGMGAVMAAALFAAAALLGPDYVVKRRRARLEREYREGFPDLLDLLVASVEAGLSLDAAVSRVADELTRRYPHLAMHVKFLTLELRAGRARRDAWAALADRLGLDEARSLATMLRQAEEMGTSLGETLAIFSDEMRSKRMLRAEEKAMALPAKLMIPLILFIFPCLLGVLMLPAAFKIAKTLLNH
ncbi:MAG TPA: type II secretion system F family protein [Caulobacteraceae bacterium]|nr:type II secretion system F family protein [Caulobacteraceae bacterium]